MISAEIICDSIGPMGDRLTSVVGEIPRIVLAELNTHKMLSKNSASSRAIPYKKMLERITNDSFYPIKWMKDHSGMQGNEFFDDDEHIALLETNWRSAKEFAIQQSKYLSENGLTKQICNRLLEPFMWHKVLLSATEWQNFFSLRAEEHAEIHIQDFAYKLLAEYNKYKPKQLKEGEWHLPFGDNIIDNDLELILDEKMRTNEFYTHKTSDIENLKLKVVTARCARTSYNNFDGSDDYEKDIKMHDDNLSKNGHFSPFEHPGKTMYEREYFNHGKMMIVESDYIDYNRKDFDLGKSKILSQFNNPITNIIEYNIIEYGWCGNFRGFIQYRKQFFNENRKDSRVN